MEQIYNDINNPASLSSPQNLYNEIKKTDDNVKFKHVEDFLASKNSYTLHKVRKHKFKKRYFMFTRPGQYLLSDVTYLTTYSTNSAKYLLIFQDGFSRYIWCYPVIDLKAITIIKCAKDVLSQSPYKFIKFFSDKGQEYKSKKFLQFLKSEKIQPYNTFSNVKVGTIEIFNRTLKRKIAKYVTHFNKENILKVLPQIIDTYNRTKNRGILFRRPIDIFLETDKEKLFDFRGQLYKQKAQDIGIIKIKFSPGDTVRIKSATRQFSRAIDTINTSELFKIHEVLQTVPPTYKLTDLDNEIIEGAFYAEELTKAIDTGYYDIEILKTRKHKGRKEFLVQFINYPSSATRWISEKDLKKKNEHETCKSFEKFYIENSCNVSFREISLFQKY